MMPSNGLNEPYIYCIIHVFVWTRPLLYSFHLKLELPSVIHPPVAALSGRDAVAHDIAVRAPNEFAIIPCLFLPFNIIRSLVQTIQI